MGSFEYWPRPGHPQLPRDERMEVLRHEFQWRLRRERLHLRRLSAKLERAKADATPVYDELQVLARRVAGAAALYEHPNVCDAACTLEEAAISALRARAGHDDAQVWHAVRALALTMPL